MLWHVIWTLVIVLGSAPALAVTIEEHTTDPNAHPTPPTHNHTGSSSGGTLDPAGLTCSGTVGQLLQSDGDNTCSFVSTAGDISTVGSCTSGVCGTNGGTDIFPLHYEGTADTYETQWTVTDPTADRSLVWQNLGGTIAVQDAALTNKSIPFANSSKQLDEDNTNLCWDDGNNRIGIGTCAPSVQAEVRAAAGAAGTLLLSSAETTVVDGDTLGVVQFTAPAEGSGTDALLLAASVSAEADDTFAADNNDTDLVFKTAVSEAATEKMRLSGAGVLSVGATSVSAVNVTAAAGAHGKLALRSNELTVVDGDVLGRIDFQAPLESSGTDAILIPAALWAESDATFDASTNTTSIVFATGTSEAAAERMRVNASGLAVADVTVSTSMNIPNSTSLPGSCDVGDSYMDTNATSGQRFYLCESSNTWAVQSGGSDTNANTICSGSTTYLDGEGGCDDRGLVTGSGTAVIAGGASAIGDLKFTIQNDDNTYNKTLGIHTDRDSQYGIQNVYIFDTQGTAANSDYPYYQQYYTDDVGGTERQIAIDYIVCADLTPSGTDSDNFDCSRGFYNTNNGTGINALATLSAAGVWTDASLLSGKSYNGPYVNYWPEGIIPKLKNITLERYHPAHADTSDPYLELHFSPHAAEWHAEFGLGTWSPVNPPAPDNPDPTPPPQVAGISAKEMAGIALAGLLELDARIAALEAE